MTTEEGVDDIRGIQDMGVGTKRKEDSSSSNQEKKRKTSVPHGPHRQGQGYQDQGQNCDAPKPGGPLTTSQLAEYKWRSGYPTPL